MSALQAEKSIIGGLLLENNTWDLVSDKLKPEHFADKTNQLIFCEIERQLNNGRACDVITIHEGLSGQVELSQLNDMAMYVPSAKNITRYVDIVVDRYKSRQMIQVSNEILDLANDNDTPIDERINQAQQMLGKLMLDAKKDEWMNVYEGLVKHTELIDKRSRGQQTSIPTGLEDIDDYLDGGLKIGELVIVGARPSMGKTALGLTIGVNVAKSHKVAVLSMEMSHEQINDRLAAMLAKVSMSSIKRPEKDSGLDWEKLLSGVESAKDLKLKVLDQGGLNINQVRTKTRNLKRLHGLDVLIVDYIGLMAGLDQKANRNTQLEEISRGLKDLAKELSISVVCLAQLNRKSEERPDQMPMLSDLRDSGAIEQDADVIMFIKRPIMANQDLGDDWKNYAKLSIAKNRQGRCGYLNLFYQADQTTFKNWYGEPPGKNQVKKKGYDL